MTVLREPGSSIEHLICDNKQKNTATRFNEAGVFKRILPTISNKRLIIKILIAYRISNAMHRKRQRTLKKRVRCEKTVKASLRRAFPGRI